MHNKSCLWCLFIDLSVNLIHACLWPDPVWNPSSELRISPPMTSKCHFKIDLQLENLMKVTMIETSSELRISPLMTSKCHFKIDLQLKNLMKETMIEKPHVILHWETNRIEGSAVLCHWKQKDHSTKGKTKHKKDHGVEYSRSEKNHKLSSMISNGGRI